MQFPSKAPWEIHGFLNHLPPIPFTRFLTALAPSDASVSTSLSLGVRGSSLNPGIEMSTGLLAKETRGGMLVKSYRNTAQPRSRATTSLDQVSIQKIASDGCDDATNEERETLIAVADQ